MVLSMSTVWTIKVSKKLDSLVENIVKLLGYTSKAEFIREAVREALLRKNTGLLGLHSMDKLCISKGDPKKALEELSSLAVPKEVILRELEEGRKEIEDFIE